MKTLVSYTHDQASSRWIAVCDDLSLTIESDSFKELVEDLSKALPIAYKAQQKAKVEFAKKTVNESRERMDALHNKNNGRY